MNSSSLRESKCECKKSRKFLLLCYKEGQGRPLLWERERAGQVRTAERRQAQLRASAPLHDAEGSIRVGAGGFGALCLGVSSRLQEGKN